MFNIRKTVSLSIVALILGTGSHSLARSMECSVEFTTASNSGLLPSEYAIKLNATEIQRHGDLDLKKCTITEAQGLTLSFCATDDLEAVGIYHAGVTILAKSGQEELFSVAHDLLATPKRGQDLVSLISRSALTPQFTQKMDKANLIYPEYAGGDSLMIDEAVMTGFKKGILSTDDIVSINIKTCQLK